MNQKRNKLSLASIAIHLTFILFCIACILPLLAVVSISLSKESDLVKYGYHLIPSKISFEAYQFIFKNPKEILNSYLVTSIITISGAFFGLLITSMFAYALSRKDFKPKTALTFFVFFTMIFNGGLVPTYMVMTKVLHLNNSILALIIPGLVNAWFLIIMRTYFQSVPDSLIEAAKIDGASEFRIFFQIMLPLSKPSLATIGLFLTLNYWNEWFGALLYLSPSSNLVPLQYMLYKIMANMQALRDMIALGANVNVDISSMPTESARMAMCVIAAGPMLFVFPFFQKYFVKGLTVGAVKG